MCVQIFNEIDADGSGYITPDEVVVGFKKMGAILSPDDAKAIVSEAVYVVYIIYDVTDP